MSGLDQKSIEPNLRFPEFNEPWAKKQLGEFMGFKNGINADKAQYGSGRKFINVLDIIDDRPIMHDQIIGRVDVPDKEFEKNEVVFGDVLFQRSSETRKEAGQSNIYLDKNQSATFGGFVIRGRPIISFDPVYFNYLLKTSAARKEVTTKSGGSTRFNVGQKSLSEVYISVALQGEEQRKIAEFLGSVDAKLDALRRKRVLLAEYKRGVMQKLFTQEIRFVGDGERPFADWKVKKLGDIADINMGQSPPSQSYNDNEVGLPLIQGNADIQNRVTSPRRFTSEPTKVCKVGEIVMSVRAPVGEVAYSMHHACIGRGVCSINSKTHSSNQYLYQWLLWFEPKWVSIGQGSTFTAISGKDIRTLGMQLPNRDEQQKIANFLTAIDDKITAVDQQIEQMETFKKGLLQQLFV